MKTSKWFFTIIITLFLTASAGCAQRVTVSPGKTGDIAQRWEWAVREARQYSGGVWIGYGIERLMGEHSYIGNHSNQNTELVTLEEIIAGTTGATMKSFPNAQDSARQAAERTLLHRQPQDQAGPKVLKKVAIIFYFPENPIEISRAADLKISNFSLPVDLENRPLIWLGRAGQQESISFLSRSYRRAASDEVKKELIVAIGLHQIAAEVVPFLSNVVESDDQDALREDATFWLGQQASAQAVDLLAHTARTDRSQSVREKAVFALSQHRSPQARDTLLSLAREAQNEGVREEAVFWLGQSDDPGVVGMLTNLAKADPVPGVRKKAVFALSQQGSEASVDALIDLARHGGNPEVRKEAIFWLGQIASDSVAGELKDMAYGDPDTEIQEQAVFALSQLPDRSGIPTLIDIAGGHSNVSVRKKAIFWLGQSGDPRAVEAIVQIIKSQ